MRGNERGRERKRGEIEGEKVAEGEVRGKRERNEKTLET